MNNISLCNSLLYYVNSVRLVHVMLIILLIKEIKMPALHPHQKLILVILGHLWLLAGVGFCTWSLIHINQSSLTNVTVFNWSNLLLVFISLWLGLICSVMGIAHLKMMCLFCMTHSCA